MAKKFYSLLLYLFVQYCFLVSVVRGQALLPNQLPNLVLWLRADSVIKDGNNRVSSWVNTIGGADFDQSVINQQPLWVDNQWNGQPVIRFNGSNYLDGGDNYDVGYNSRTVFVVFQANNSQYSVLAKSLYGAADNRYAINNGGSGVQVFYRDNSDYLLSSMASPVGRNLWSNLINRNSQQISLYRNSISVGAPLSGLQGGGYNFNSGFRFIVGGFNNSDDSGVEPSLNLDGSGATL